MTNCLACRDGNLPTLHVCDKCNKKVHTFDDCSKNIGDDEGAGEKRRCFDCDRKENPNGNKFIFLCYLMQIISFISILTMNMLLANTGT